MNRNNNHPIQQRNKASNQGLQNKRKNSNRQSVKTKKTLYNSKNTNAKRKKLPPQKTNINSRVVERKTYNYSNNNKNNNIVHFDKKFFTLKELLSLNVDVSMTDKVFNNGEMKYVINDLNVLSKINDGTWNGGKKEENTVEDAFEPNILPKQNNSYEQNLNSIQNNSNYNHTNQLYDGQNYSNYNYDNQQYDIQNDINYDYYNQQNYMQNNSYYDEYQQQYYVNNNLNYDNYYDQNNLNNQNGYQEPIYYDDSYQEYDGSQTGENQEVYNFDFNDEPQYVGMENQQQIQNNIYQENNIPQSEEFQNYINTDLIDNKEIENINNSYNSEELNQPSELITEEFTNNENYDFNVSGNEEIYYDDLSSFESSRNIVDPNNTNEIATSKDIINWNKKLWKTEDIIYKIYNISYNQNHENPNDGCLYNFSFDIYPGDRIAIMSHDSKSDSLIMDILQNNINKDSGYVFFNLKREQKWFDIYSEEYSGFDIEMYNRRYEAIYQFQSPDYLSYGRGKSDTVASTFKKIFNSVDYVINNKIFEDLLYLLDLEQYLDLGVSQMNPNQIRKFNFICDVLIGKKILMMIDLTEGFDITQKISFYRYINSLYQDSDTVILFNVKDSFEVKLLANRLMIIDDGQMAVNKRITDILDKFETLDSFIVEAFDRLYKKYLRE